MLAAAVIKVLALPQRVDKAAAAAALASRDHEEADVVHAIPAVAEQECLALLLD